VPSADFLARLGIFVRHGFLSDDLCKHIITDIRSGEPVPAPIGNDQGAYVVDTSVRQAFAIKVSEATRTLVEAPLRALQPSLEEHFHAALSHHQEPTFLFYGVGDHYAPHRDNRRDEGACSPSREREVSAVVFLNDPSENETDGGYGGGELTLFGLIKAPGTEARGLSLAAKRGLLVAFCSDLLHQVTPVTHGERFTMVTWYASAGPARIQRRP
jgi:SM-20-related protein